MNDVTAQIQEYIRNNFVFTDDEVPVDASLSETGVIDSTGILEVVMFLEETFGIEVDDEEVVAEHFDSIAGLTRYVQRKVGG